MKHCHALNMFITFWHLKPYVLICSYQKDRIYDSDDHRCKYQRTKNISLETATLKELFLDYSRVFLQLILSAVSFTTKTLTIVDF